MSNKIKIFTNGLYKENAIFYQLLGMCPTLAVTTSAINGLAMGLATTAVLVMSNVVVALLRNFIPSKIRIPSFIVIIATFVTIIGMVMEGFVPVLYANLGLSIPLIVVNCLILGRAVSFAYNNGIYESLLDGLGMGLGHSIALTILGSVREILGAGSIFWDDNEPKIHLHAAMGHHGDTLTACVRKGTKVYLILEVVIFELEGINATRPWYEKGGFNRLTFS